MCFFLYGLQASGDIDSHFSSKIMEPHLIIFEHDHGIAQVFIAAEDESLLEVPANTIGEAIVFLMSIYYVFNVSYPKPYKPLLFFFQDVLMDKADSGKRPTKYSSFIATLTF